MLQAARVDPEGLVGMFEKLQEGRGQTPSALQYLSTHPLTAARLAELRQLIRNGTVDPVPLLPEVEWAQVRSFCGS
ncbi:MAG TPA: hypothetical protein VNN17_03950 [Terriglobia bacterium]|nr:hypothetical protein [Terriglobia bacterium]